MSSDKGNPGPNPSRKRIGRPKSSIASKRIYTEVPEEVGIYCRAPGSRLRAPWCQSSTSLLSDGSYRLYYSHKHLPLNAVVVYKDCAHIFVRNRGQNLTTKRQLSFSDNDHTDLMDPDLTSVVSESDEESSTEVARSKL